MAARDRLLGYGDVHRDSSDAPGERCGGRTVAIALVVLQLLVATNHATAAIQSHSMLNAIMGAVNYACVVFGTLALRLRTVGRDLPSREQFGR